MKYTIPDVSANVIQQCIEALSKKEGDLKYISEYAQVGIESVKRAIILGEQLNFFIVDKDLIKLSPNCSSLLNHVDNNIQLLFKEALFNYKPFILICDYLLNDETTEESVRKTKVVFEIDSNVVIIQKTMSSLCKCFGVKTLNKEEIGKLLSQSKVQYSHINNVINSINDQLSAQLLISNKLGKGCYNTITDPERKLLCDALIKVTKNPANAIDDVSSAFESFLRRIGYSNQVNLEKSNGIDEIGQVLGSKDNQIILNEHKKMCSFIGTFRNPAIHKVDKTSLNHWKIEADSAIEIILLILTCMRSIHVYVSEGKKLII